MLDIILEMTIKIREIDVRQVGDVVAEMCKEANYYLGEDTLQAFEKGLREEVSPKGKDVFKHLLENARIAKEEKVPICQDTGTAVLFIELGQDVHLMGGNLIEALNEGVRQGYNVGYLRKSIVNDPLKRVNTNDNTPAIIYVDIVSGDKVRLTLIPKGGGAENMSDIKMLNPFHGAQDVIDFVVKTVSRAGANPCPPVVVGVGLGGTFEKVAFLAKKALLRPLNQYNPDPFYANFEKKMLQEINKIGIGPQGFGGIFTALAVHIEVYPCHIASMPVAVNLNCHANRHVERVI